MDTENLSGIPPQVTLSGLDAGAGGSFSGASQQGLGPGPGTAPGSGMTGGLDLAQLIQLLQSQQGAEAGVGTGADILSSLTQGSLGQQTGGLGAGSFGQTQPGYVAGQTAAGGPAQAASDAAAGSADPFAIIQKILGLGQKGASLLGGAQQGTGATTASPTAPSGGSSSPFGAPTGAEQAAFQTGVASPINAGDDLLRSGIFQGGLGGTNLLNDPTLGNLFTTGALSGWDGSMESLTQLMASDPALKNALFEGTVGGSLGETMSAPGGTAGFSLGGDTTLDTSLSGDQGTNWLGAGSGAVSGALGLMNLLRGIEGGNVPGSIGGALGTAGGLAQLLGSSPALMESLGISSGALGSIGGGIGGLGGLLNLAQGIQSGNPMQIGSGVLGAAQGLNTLGLLGGSGAGSLGSLIATQFPQLASALVSAMGTGASAGAGVGAAAAAPAVSAALSALGGAAAPLVAALVSYLGNAEEMRARDSGWWNNPIKGALYSNATAGVGQSNAILDRLNQGDGMAGLTTEQLMSALAPSINSLLPYYATAQGGRGAIRASDTVTGRKQGPTSSGAAYTGDGASPEQYTQNFFDARQGVVGLINELMNRGVTYEQLGQTPITGDWSMRSLDAGGTPDEFLARNRAKYAPEAQELINQAHGANRTTLGQQEADQLAAQGINPATLGYAQDASGMWSKSAAIPQGLSLTPEHMLTAALGSSMLAPDKDTNASGLMTSMYGGPLWAAMARMGVPEFTDLIAQNFDPWKVLRTLTPEQQVGALDPYVLQPWRIEEGQRIQDFTSGGGGDGGDGGF